MPRRWPHRCIHLQIADRCEGSRSYHPLNKLRTLQNHLGATLVVHDIIKYVAESGICCGIVSRCRRHSGMVLCRHSYEV